MEFYRAIKYIRLSYTDDRNTESDSVGNQRRMIDDFIAKHPEIDAVAEKIDDGYSGVLFDRPAFQEMMQMIQRGEANCVIVKDLSRLGREYIETGRYTDDTVAEINAVPGQPKKFTRAHSCEECRCDDGLVFFPVKGLKQFFEIGCIQRLHLCLTNSWKDAGTGRILCEVSNAYSNVQGPVQAAVNIFDGLWTEPLCQYLIVKTLNNGSPQSS